MTIECYYKWCPYHSYHDPNEEGPFCYESKCHAEPDQIDMYAMYRQAEITSVMSSDITKPRYQVIRGNDVFQKGDQISFEIDGSIRRYDTPDEPVEEIQRERAIHELVGVEYRLDREYMIQLKDRYLNAVREIGDILESHWTPVDLIN